MLRVDIRDLQRGPVRTEGQLPPDDPTFEGLGLDLVGPVVVHGQLQATGEGEYLWRGDLHGVVRGECRRCLTEVLDEVDVAVDAAVKDLRPGGWVAVAGVLPQTVKAGASVPTPAQLLIKWYRVLAIDDETRDDIEVHDPGGGIQTGVYARRLMLDGPNWPNVAGQTYIPGLRAIILPNVIGVSTRTLPMELPGAWTVQHYP